MRYLVEPVGQGSRHLGTSIADLPRVGKGSFSLSSLPRASDTPNTKIIGIFCDIANTSAKITVHNQSQHYIH